MVRDDRNKFLSEMKRCIAFSAVPGSREAWIPCVRDAQAGFALCERHSDAVAGVLMGNCVAGIAEDARKELKKQQRAERKRLAGFRRKALAAAKARRYRAIELLLDGDKYDVPVNDAEVAPQELIARHEQA